MTTTTDLHRAAPLEADPDPQDAVDRLYRRLVARPAGLSAREADRRLIQYGPNAIGRSDRTHWAAELARQFAHPLALLLWLAAALSWASGSQTLGIAIVAVIVLNAALAFAQEEQAERATEALGALLPVRARVLRGGVEAEIDAAGLVPGDVLLLSEGDRISADARLVSGQVQLDMAALTGESLPSRAARAPMPASRPCSTPRTLSSPGRCAPPVRQRRSSTRPA